MRRTPTFLLLLFMLFAVAACGDDDASADPASLSSCDAVADASIDLLQETLDVIDSLSAEELVALGESDEPPAALADVETRGNALEERATTLGCTDEQMTSLMIARVDQLDSESIFGQFLIESIRNGDGGFFEG